MSSTERRAAADARQGGDHRADHDPLGHHRDRRKRDEGVGEPNHVRSQR